MNTHSVLDLPSAIINSSTDPPAAACDAIADAAQPPPTTCRAQRAAHGRADAWVAVVVCAYLRIWIFHITLSPGGRRLGQPPGADLHQRRRPLLHLLGRRLGDRRQPETVAPNDVWALQRRLFGLARASGPQCAAFAATLKIYQRALRAARRPCPAGVHLHVRRAPVIRTRGRRRRTARRAVARGTSGDDGSGPRAIIVRFPAPDGAAVACLARRNDGGLYRGGRPPDGGLPALYNVISSGPDSSPVGVAR